MAVGGAQTQGFMTACTILPIELSKLHKILNLLVNLLNAIRSESTDITVGGCGVKNRC